jgi:hypothetical protein
MSREILSRRFARQFARRFRKQSAPSCGQLPMSRGGSHPRGWMSLPAAALAIGALAIGTGCSEDEGLAYSKDMRPLFENCTTCHRPGGPWGPPPTGLAIDILNPYGSGGLVVTKNTWWVSYPPGSATPSETPENNVTPGDPDDSFLMVKISDPDLENSTPHAGSSMPYRPPRLTDEELASVRTWIQAGATQSAQFLSEVLPIIGNAGRFDAPRTDGKCLYCHYANTPNSPDLTDPFGTDGLVNVAAAYRAGAVRVKPSDPVASFLMTKLEATEASSEYGAPMPRRFDRLTDSQVDRVRQWIEEGAKP